MQRVTLPAPRGKGQSTFVCLDAEKPSGTKRAAKSPTLTALVLPPDASDGAPVRTLKLIGREAWCLSELVKAGHTGITSLGYPGARLSHYVFCLRRQGIVIDMTPEANGGTFIGKYGRYRLRSNVRVIESTSLDRVRP